MTRESDRHEELRGLLEALCEGEIAREQRMRLEEIVLADSEAEAFYIEYMHIQSELRRKFGGTPPGRGDEVRATRRRAGQEARYRPWSLRAVAVVVVVGVFALLPGLIVAVRRPAGVPTRPTTLDAANRAVPAVGTRPTAAGGAALAVLIKMDDALFKPADGPRFAEGDVVAARRLQLDSGRVTLAFLNGVILTLDGPADLDLESMDRVYCRRGKLRAQVPHGAEGFIVAAPGSAVVDLGTVFGLNIEPDGKARVMVFEGKAEAAVIGEAGNARCMQLVGERESFDIDPVKGDIKAAVAETGNFVTRPHLVAPPLTLDKTYPSAVLESKPWGYWRFESMADGATPNEIPGRPALRAIGSVHVDEGPAGSRAAVFGEGEAEQYLAMDGSWEPKREPGHAVELWAMPAQIRHATLVSLIFDSSLPPKEPGVFKHFLLMEQTARDRQAFHKPASARFLHRWLPDSWAGNNVYSDAIFAPYRWHHLVAQTDGDRMVLYMDGSPSQSLPFDPSNVTEPCRMLVGRLTDSPDPTLVRGFVGRIDELAVYDHPLSLEEIRRHHRLASSRHPSS